MLHNIASVPEQARLLQEYNILPKSTERLLAMANPGGKWNPMAWPTHLAPSAPESGGPNAIADEHDEELEREELEREELRREMLRREEMKCAAQRSQ